MKVTVDNKEKDSERPFPKLMISGSGQIVFFYQPERGMKLNNDASWVGHYSDEWVMAAFKDFTGTVKLEND